MKFLSLVSALGAAGVAFAAPRSGPVLQPNAYAVAPLSTVAGLQADNGDSRMFYQRTDNSIWMTCVSGHWESGGKTTCDVQIVARTEALGSTPLAVVGDSTLNEWHLYFVSPTNTLSEYIFQTSTISATNPSGIRGGTSCSDCITSELFNVVSTKNKALWAMMQNDNGVRKIRVWFVSAGQPNTLTEAGKRGDEVWKLIGMPNGTAN
ncbi:hypothetical protein Moror_4683 [Moniliophthora roreri MCA 2997]|nr:hypothetical protein Moror_4683 [Moniliophthora roreri MCA 2997]KAI3613065.1 hypothetical protein WG66_001422 [Moniliophthora roreri]